MLTEKTCSLEIACYVIEPLLETKTAILLS